MKLLAEKYWSQFQSDGRKFEELVQQLLELEYRGKTFHITKSSHDGARDLETEVPILGEIKAEIWAECKYRSKRLPIHQVAMTLVMAYIENAKAILFFSYSPVNRKFASYLSRFKERAKIPVQVFDDCALETLILRHSDEKIIQDFFPDFFRERPLKPTEAVDHGSLSATCDVLQNGAKIICRVPEDALPYATLTDHITLWLTLRNHSTSASITATLSLPDLARQGDFLCLTDGTEGDQFQQKLTLSPGEVCACRFDFRIRRFSGILRLPAVCVTWEGMRRVLYPGQLRGRWLAEAPLIGQEFHSALSAQQRGMHAQTVLIAQVSGKSGVGKSRLLKEILLQASASGKQTFFWDTDFQKGDYITLMRSIISSLEGLPLLQKRTKGVLLADSETPARRLFAAQLLYQRDKLSACSCQKLAEYLAGLMREKTVWIVLDNVQNCDERTLDTLDHLTDILQEQKINSGLVLAFNEDFLFQGTKAEQLGRRISALSARKPEQYQTYLLHDFHRAEALEYLRACLSCRKPGQTPEPAEKEAFAGTLEMIVDRWGTRPFYLQNILLYLEQKDILTRTEESGFFVSDIAAFWEQIQVLPPTLSALLAQRTECVLDSLPDENCKEECIQILTLLTVSEALPADVCRELFGAFRMRTILLQAGILSENADGSVSLYHQYFEQYFRKAYPLHNASEALLRRFVAAVEKRKAVSSLLIPVVLAQYVLGEITDTYYQKLLKRLTAGQIDAKISPHLLPILAELLDRDLETMPVSKYVQCYYAICFMVANREGIERACTFYERLLGYFVADPQMFSRQFEPLFALMREYVISLNNLNRNSMGLKQLDAIQGGICRLSLPEMKKQQYASTLYEVRCMLHYWTADTEQAVTDAKYAVVTADAGQAPWKKLSALREYGYTYYYALNAAELRDRMCEQWDRGYELYFRLQPNGPDSDTPQGLQPFIATHLVSSLADLARQDMAGAAEKVSVLSKYLNKTGMPFYELKIRLLRAQFLLLRDFQQYGMLKQTEEVHRLIQQAADQCLIFYDLQDYPVCFYMQAISYLLSGEHKKAEDSFLKTCRVLQAQMDRHSEASQSETVWTYFYQDMALQLRGMDRPFPEDLLQKIHTCDIRRAVRRICRCSDLDFQYMWEDRTAVTAITDGEGRWNFPKV